MMKNVKIGKKLGTGFGLLILITLIVSIVTVRYMKVLSDLTSKLYRHPYTVSTTILKINANIREPAENNLPGTSFDGNIPFR